MIPTNRTLIRLENPDVVYRTEAEKYEAVVNGIIQEDNTHAAGIKQLHESGQPVLSARFPSKSPNISPNC